LPFILSFWNLTEILTLKSHGLNCIKEEYVILCNTQFCKKEERRAKVGNASRVEERAEEETVYECKLFLF
jgi:hypothetical protein